MSFYDVFSGSAVTPSDVSYARVNLTADSTQFEWPGSYDTTNTMARLMTLAGDQEGNVLILPPANEVEKGTDILMYNLGAYGITVQDNTSGAIVSIPAGQVRYLFLADNNSAAGVWYTFTFGTGTSAADASMLDGYGLLPIDSTLNQTHSVTSASNNFTIAETDRAKLYYATQGLTVTLPVASSMTTGFFFLLRNTGTGTVTLARSGADTIDGTTSIALAPSESCQVHCLGGTSWVTVGRGRSVDYTITQLSKAVGGGVDVTLNSSEAANKILKLTGILTANINVIVPSVASEYVINNATTGSYSLTVKTAAGSGVVVAQNQQYIVYCDGTNVYNLPSTLPSGSVLFVDGAAATPSVTFASDTTTGLFRAAGVLLGVAISGVEVARFTSAGITGAIGAGTANTGRFTTVTATGLTSGRVAFMTTGGLLTDDSNFTYDSVNDRLLIGTTTNTNSSSLATGGTISETVSSVQYLAASQYDVGSGANEIPLNGLLGTMAFQNSEAISVGGALVTSDTTVGIGYGTGSGGAVTQGTSRTTGVTLNKTNGSITLVSAAGSASWQSFTVTCDKVAATDTVVVSQKSGTDLNMIFVTAVAAGSFRISFATTGGTTVEQPVFNFAVIKAVAA